MADVLAQYAEAIHHQLSKYFTLEESQVIESVIFANIFTRNDKQINNVFFTNSYDQQRYKI